MYLLKKLFFILYYKKLVDILFLCISTITLKHEKRGKWRGIALCNDEKGDLNGMISLVIEVICIIYSKSIRYYGERKRRS